MPYDGPMDHDERERLAERVREACVAAAMRAHEDAGFAGLCAEGRWEAAVDAMRSLDLGTIAASAAEHAPR